MLIELSNLSTINSESIVSIKKENGVWRLKMSNGYPVNLSLNEYEWIMTIDGNLVQVVDDLAVNLDAIIIFETNESGYLIGWESEPPIQIDSAKGELLKEHLLTKHQHIVLSERVSFLESKEIVPNFRIL